MTNRAGRLLHGLALYRLRRLHPLYRIEDAMPRRRSRPYRNNEEHYPIPLSPGGMNNTLGCGPEPGEKVMTDEDSSIRKAHNLAASRELILQSKHLLELSRVLRSQTIGDIEASREHLARLRVRESSAEQRTQS